MVLIFYLLYLLNAHNTLNGPADSNNNLCANETIKQAQPDLVPCFFSHETLLNSIEKVSSAPDKYDWIPTPTQMDLHSWEYSRNSSGTRVNTFYWNFFMSRVVSLTLDSSKMIKEGFRHIWLDNDGELVAARNNFSDTVIVRSKAIKLPHKNTQIGFDQGGNYFFISDFGNTDIRKSTDPELSLATKYLFTEKIVSDEDYVFLIGRNCSIYVYTIQNDTLVESRQIRVDSPKGAPWGHDLRIVDLDVVTMRAIVLCSMEVPLVYFSRWYVVNIETGEAIQGPRWTSKRLGFFLSEPLANSLQGR